MFCCSLSRTNNRFLPQIPLFVVTVTSGETHQLVIVDVNCKVMMWYWKVCTIGTICSPQPKKVYVLKVLTQPKSEWKTVEKPKWLETLTSHSPPLFQSTNKLQRIFQSCIEVKREREDWGKRKLTFNLPFSCYVHLHSHHEQPPLWFHHRLLRWLQRCRTESKAHVGTDKRSHGVLSIRKTF